MASTTFAFVCIFLLLTQRIAAEVEEFIPPPKSSAKPLEGPAADRTPVAIPTDSYREETFQPTPEDKTKKNLKYGLTAAAVGAAVIGAAGAAGAAAYQHYKKTHNATATTTIDTPLGSTVADIGLD